VPGANGTLTHHDLTPLIAALADATVLLLQLEIPLETVIAAAQIARKSGVTVILDPAPAQALPPELFKAVDILTPNETEAAALVGFAVHDERAAEQAAQILIGRGVGRVVVKMGSKGAYWNDSARGRFESAFPVNAVDTVAAGDAFNGALAAALSSGYDFPGAVRWGMAAGALSATKPGAQPSMPDRASIMAMVQQGRLGEDSGQ
jgi:ribokinase